MRLMRAPTMENTLPYRKGEGWGYYNDDESAVSGAGWGDGEGRGEGYDEDPICGNGDGIGRGFTWGCGSARCHGDGYGYGCGTFRDDMWREGWDNALRDGTVTVEVVTP
jgi:hypothetical protein